MGDFEDMLSSILSSPKDMEKIMGLARELSGGALSGSDALSGSTLSGSDTPSGSTLSGSDTLSGGNAPREPENEQKSSARRDSGGIPGLGGLDPKLLGAIGRIMSGLNSAGDGKAALIASMKPYVRPERRAALDRAVKIAKLARVARLAVSELGGDFDLGL